MRLLIAGLLVRVQSGEQSRTSMAYAAVDRAWGCSHSLLSPTTPARIDLGSRVVGRGSGRGHSLALAMRPDMRTLRGRQGPVSPKFQGYQPPASVSADQRHPESG